MTFTSKTEINPLCDSKGGPHAEKAHHSVMSAKIEASVAVGEPFYISVKEYNDAELALLVQTGCDLGDAGDFVLTFFPKKAEAMRLRNALKKAQTQLTQWMRDHRKRGGDW